MVASEIYFSSLNFMNSKCNCSKKIYFSGLAPTFDIEFSLKIPSGCINFITIQMQYHFNNLDWRIY